jgi:stage V sporulation protein R
MGLAYEIVINSNPCIAYLMEENTMTMQTLVIAHAAFGHNAFMKNNYLFKQWTQADAIIDYLAFARQYLSQCEERYGVEAVEAVLDACHALQAYGVDRYTHPAPLSAAAEQRRQQERWQQVEREVNVLWSTLPKRTAVSEPTTDNRFEPQENILYVIEKQAPELPQWKREIIRIVRKIAQYFYPQRQTKVLNEGFATFVHYYILNRLGEKGLLTAGAMQEFLHTHTSVVMQPDFGPINPYALGFAIFMDVKRMCEHPTDEDRTWFRDIAGGPWLATVKLMAESFKDESAILQFLSPRLMRHFRFFAVRDDDQQPELEVTAIHNDEGYRRVRKVLAEQHDISLQDPIIEVVNVDRRGDRCLTLRHFANRRRQLHTADANKVLLYTAQLWGFPVELEVEEAGTVQSTLKANVEGII